MKDMDYPRAVPSWKSDVRKRVQARASERERLLETLAQSRRRSLRIALACVVGAALVLLRAFL